MRVIGWQSVGEFSRLAYYLRIPIATSTFASITFGVPVQSVEIYRTISQGLDDFLPGQKTSLEFNAGVVAVFCLCGGLWLCSTLLALTYDRSENPQFRSTFWAIALLPILIAFAPIAGLALGLSEAMKSSPTQELAAAIKPVVGRMVKIGVDAPSVMQGILAKYTSDLLEYNNRLQSTLWASLAAGAAIAVMFFFVGRSTIARRLLTPDHTFLNNRVSGTIYLVIAVIVLFLIFGPVAIPQDLGTIAVFSLFVIVVTLVLVHLSYLSDKYRFPIVGIAVLLAIFFAALDTNDNHRIGTRKYDKQRASLPLPALKDKFSDWLASRVDISRYAGKPYPIYIVAAQGGGIYAAFNAATVLSAFEEACPLFSEHVFAISGVSGGSVGASVFATLVNARGRRSLDEGTALDCHVGSPRPGIVDKQSIIRAADSILSQDLLSPLVAGALFPDAVQRFLPLPVRALDRARRLESALEAAAEKTLKDLHAKDPHQWRSTENLLAGAYNSHWSSKGNVPALVFNTTEVHSGSRRVIAPFRFAGEREIRPVPMGDGSSKLVPLSTATILSARFPWLTPAGWFAETPPPSVDGAIAKRRKVLLADGGYFDNTATITALDLAASLRAAAKEAGFEDKIVIKLVVLTKQFQPSKASYAFSEVVAPIQALWNARVAQESLLVGHAEKLAKETVHTIALRDLSYRLALGWRLAPITMLLVEAQNGSSGQCTADGKSFDAVCVIDKIAKELTTAK